MSLVVYRLFVGGFCWFDILGVLLGYRYFIVLILEC